MGLRLLFFRDSCDTNAKPFITHYNAEHRELPAYLPFFR